MIFLWARSHLRFHLFVFVCRIGSKLVNRLEVERISEIERVGEERGVERGGGRWGMSGEVC
jgi:hypothetical protein